MILFRRTCLSEKKLARGMYSCRESNVHLPFNYILPGVTALYTVRSIRLVQIAVTQFLQGYLRESDNIMIHSSIRASRLLPHNGIFQTGVPMFNCFRMSWNPEKLTAIYFYLSLVANEFLHCNKYFIPLHP